MQDIFRICSRALFRKSNLHFVMVYLLIPGQNHFTDAAYHGCHNDCFTFATSSSPFYYGRHHQQCRSRDGTLRAPCAKFTPLSRNYPRGGREATNVASDCWSEIRVMIKLHQRRDANLCYRTEVLYVQQLKIRQGHTTMTAC
jgi:hypothetical protein